MSRKDPCITRIGEHETEVCIGSFMNPQSTRVLYSYSTPVAVYIPHIVALCTTCKYSRTTTRHINKALKRWSVPEILVEQKCIEEIASLTVYLG